MTEHAAAVIWFDKLGRGDVARVGGKNASLGEMVRNLESKGVRVPPGFATTADAYWRYLDANGLKQKIAESLAALEAGHSPLAEVGATIRREVLRGKWPQAWPKDPSLLSRACRRAGKKTTTWRCAQRHRRGPPDASFPDSGTIQHSRRCRSARHLPALFPSLFTDRISATGPGLRPHDGRAFGRRAADGALGSRVCRRHVLDRHRDRL
jgi:phosphoenolpyruvate synthase/pyruvate phosphate dikinase